MRRTVQGISLAVFNLGLFFQQKGVCVPILHCHSCPLASFACPIGVLGHYASYLIFPFLAVGIIGVIGVLLGRALCGWVCPFGLIQDLLYKIPGRKLRLPGWARLPKYAVFVGLVLLVPMFLGVDSPWFFCRWCPVATFEAAIPNAVTAGGFSDALSAAIRLSILGIVLVAAVASQRSFCIALCPIAAMMAPFNRISALYLRRNPARCTDCGLCVSPCPARQVSDIERGILPGDSDLDCTLCLDCTKQCPHEGALHATLLGPRRGA
ncbi:MAG: 4Fe-4S binding protein [Candidatus Brocadiaceae bacterium]|jgi:polyferredoxin